MSFVVINHTMAATVATDGTFTVAYPSGTNAGTFVGGAVHKVVANQNEYSSPKDFTVAFGAASATVTWKAAASLGAGANVFVQFDTAGDAVSDAELVGVKRVSPVELVRVDLGAPIAADADAIIKAATGAELPDSTPTSVTYTATDAGTSPVDGVNTTWEFDVPRNVTFQVTHATSIVAMTAKVTGTDEYGAEVYEELAVTATGTDKTTAGKKAFKTITSVELYAAADATANTVNIGFGDVLGLPVFLPHADLILKELEDGAAATAGTTVAGVATAATAASGDVRGTYDPNSACDGAKAFSLILMLSDPRYRGAPQYTV